MHIAFQDPSLFFCGSQIVRSGMVSAQLFEQSNRKEMEETLDDPLRYTKVLIDPRHNTVIGFVIFYRSREKSLEEVYEGLEQKGIVLSDEYIKRCFPGIKKTEAECQYFGVIEAIAVSQEYRGKGFGKVLLQRAQEEMALRWPTLTRIILHVNGDNEVARMLYMTQGFTVSAHQPPHWAMVNVMEYSKEIVSL